MNGPASDTVGRLAREGRTIDAIRRLREETGLGLKEAKAVIDGLGRDGADGRAEGAAPLASRRRPRAMPPRVESLLRQGRTIEAVKALREAEALGLKDAYGRILAYLERHPELAERNRRSRFPKATILILLALGAVAVLALR